MKLDNRTKYDTRALRSILCAVHTLDASARATSRNAKPNGRLRTWAQLVVVVRYARRGDRPYTGHAYYHGGNATLSIPRERDGASSCKVRELVALWQHELWHLYRIRHADMPPTVLRCRADAPFVDRVVEYLGAQFADGRVPLAHEPVAKPEPTVDERRAIKVARLVARRDAWISKRDRAVRALAKIERSLRYYAATGVEVPAVARAARPAKRRRRRRP